MSFSQQLTDSTLINDSARDFFKDLPEEPLLESDNYFSNLYSFNNELFNTEQTPSIIGNEIFDNFNYTFDNNNNNNNNNNINNTPVLESQSPNSGRNYSNLSSGSDFSIDSMNTLSLPLTLGDISPFSSVTSSPSPLKKINSNSNNKAFNISFKMDDDAQELLFGNDTQQQQQLLNNNDTVLDSLNLLRSPFQDNRSQSNVITTQQQVQKEACSNLEKANKRNKRSYVGSHHISKLQHPKTGKKIADSRLSVAALAEVLNLKSPDEALAIEKYILDIFEHELHYPLGYKTWIRDTPRDEREELIDELYQKTKDKYPAYDKSILETIIRRSTYFMMQSRLRKERKRSRKLSKASSISSAQLSEGEI
ncbi:hypothetical protein MOSE0_H02014 [Monosporozyma servazzii]